MSPAAAPTDPIIGFFTGSGTDHAGRRHAEILAWPDARLELVHDYIQWVFPLASPSAFNPSAPLVRPATAAAFAADPSLRETLLEGLERMARFYGMEPRRLPDGEWQIELTPDFDRRARFWLNPGNHNHLRLTRILTSLRQLHCPEAAAALMDALERVHQRHPAAISPRSLAFWHEAADGPSSHIR
jgi:hypothetical protein